MSAKQKIIWAVAVSSLLLSGYCWARYQREQHWLAREAHAIADRAGAHTRREQIVALRDYVRRHVRYEGVPQDGRPFLRETAQETLQSGRGYCGEATRAFINLAWQFGIRAYRVNLHGRINHVVAEVEVRPETFVLVDPQDNPAINPYLDGQDRTLDEVVAPGSPFIDYSNLNLRRAPIVTDFVQRVRLKNSWLTWTLENPWLIWADLFFLAFLTLSLGFCVDRVLIRVYAHRFGIRLASRSASPRSPRSGLLPVSLRCPWRPPTWPWKFLRRPFTERS